MEPPKSIEEYMALTEAERKQVNPDYALKLLHGVDITKQEVKNNGSIK